VINSKINIDIYGESHGAEIGVNLSGVKKGESVSLSELQKFVDRRKPSVSVYSTSRLEPDELIVKSGIIDGKTTGGVINVEIKNVFARPKDYDNLKQIPRPGHADYPAYVKYGTKASLSGGGKFSGRLTAPLVAAGGIAVQILQRAGIQVAAYVSEIGGVSGVSYKDREISLNEIRGVDDVSFPVLCKKSKESMTRRITQAKDDLDSVGGVIEVIAYGVPVGLGDALFGGIEGAVSAIMYGIPAVKGVEFGHGFDMARMTGSQANDAYCMQGDTVRTKTNHNGGILGGMSNGSPICIRVAIKPTPSIAREQDSIDLTTRENVKLQISGRHDACIVPRAVVVCEAAVALALLEIIWR
jgi:chorismate synthase